jgi:hypothetical protein
MGAPLIREMFSNVKMPYSYTRDSPLKSKIFSLRAVDLNRQSVLFSVDMPSEHYLSDGRPASNAPSKALGRTTH